MIRSQVSAMFPILRDPPGAPYKEENICLYSIVGLHSSQFMKYLSVIMLHIEMYHLKQKHRTSRNSIYMYLCTNWNFETK